MIPYGRHSVDSDDIAAVVSALKSDWLTTGPLVEAFESALEKIVGAPCVSVSSGTAALHCAYAAIGIQPGDEIITPPITFIATQATAAHFGAKIVFADVQEDTANIDPVAVEAAITPRTKAIVAVDFGGHPADLDELRAIADRHGIYLIEDAAHSLGSIYKQKPVGSIADITTFSFFPTKNMTTTEGGAVSSINTDLLSKAKKFARQGLVRNTEALININEGPWHQEVHNFGLNYRLPDVLCALGLSQINRLESFTKKRREIFNCYQVALSNMDSIRLPIEREYVTTNWHLYSIQVQPILRRTIFEMMRKEGIGVQVNYLPAYLHPVFDRRDYPAGLCKNAEKYYAGQLSLPMHYGLTMQEQEYVVSTFSRILNTL